MEHNSETIRELLAELNYWGQYAPGGRIADTGEVSTMIDNLRQRLAELGVTVSWNGERFVIEEREEK
jgi:hypothetical protein